MNLFADLPEQLPSELVEKLLDAGPVRVERIVSTGHCSPDGFWYDQDEHEWVVVLKGNATLSFKTQDSVNLGPGDCINIPAHRKHRVESTSANGPTVWLAVFYPA